MASNLIQQKMDKQTNHKHMLKIIFVSPIFFKYNRQIIDYMLYCLTPQVQTAKLKIYFLSVGDQRVED